MHPTTTEPTFHVPGAELATWDHTAALLRAAELYWLTTVRPDGRPHTTPVVGVWHEDAFCFTTGRTEVKRHNLDASSYAGVTTGSNAWAAGTDVVVEGVAEHVTGLARTTPLAAAFRDKYGDDWPWQPTEAGFEWPGEPDRPRVYLVRPTKVLVFAKDPHGQTVFRP